MAIVLIFTLKKLRFYEKFISTFIFFSLFTIGIVSLFILSVYNWGF